MKWGVYSGLSRQALIVIIRTLISERRKQEIQSQRKRSEDESRDQSDAIAGMKDGRGREPRKAGSLWKQDKQGNGFFPRASRVN